MSHHASTAGRPWPAINLSALLDALLRSGYSRSEAVRIMAERYGRTQRAINRKLRETP
jgi:hypothetical protein